MIVRVLLYVHVHNLLKGVCSGELDAAELCGVSILLSVFVFSFVLDSHTPAHECKNLGP